MSRKTTLLAAGALAAALATAPLFAGTGATYALWQDSATIASTPILTGQFNLASASLTAGYPSVNNSWDTVRTLSEQRWVEVDGGGTWQQNHAVLRSVVSAEVEGTGLGAKLEMRYDWGRIYKAAGTNWANVTFAGAVKGVSGTTTVNANFSRTNDSGGSAYVTFTANLWPASEAATAPSGAILVADMANVTVDLRVISSATGSWALGAAGVHNPAFCSGGGYPENLSSNRVTANINAVTSNGTTIGWTASPVTETLPALYNASLCNAPRDSADPLQASLPTGAPASVSALDTPPDESSQDTTSTPVRTSVGAATDPARVPQPEAKPAPTPDPVPAPEPEPAPEPTTPVAPEPEPEPEPPVIEEQHAVKPDDLPAGDEVPQEDDPTPPEDELDTFEALDEDTA